MSEGLPSVLRFSSGVRPDSASGSLGVHSSAYEERMCVKNVSQRENVRGAVMWRTNTQLCLNISEETDE